MHEFGDSNGIAEMHPAFGEQYDSDSYNMIRYLSTTMQ